MEPSIFPVVLLKTENHLDERKFPEVSQHSAPVHGSSGSRTFRLREKEEAASLQKDEHAVWSWSLGALIEEKMPKVDLALRTEPSRYGNGKHERTR